MRDLYRETFDEIHASEALRQEVMNMTKQEQAVVKRQIPRVLLIAAVIALALAGTTLAVALPGIQEWFGQQWTEKTGQVIQKDQMGVITGLTDEVGVSDEAGGVTITVDSVTRGESAMWVLMRISGVPSEEELEAQMGQYERPIEGLPEGVMPPSRRDYDFLDMDLTFTPEIADEFPIWGLLQNSRGEDGSLTILMRYEAPADTAHTPQDAEEVTLHLEGLQWGCLTGRVPIAEGPWELTFPLPAIEPAAPLTTGKCFVTGAVEPEGAWSLAEDGPLPTEEVEFQDIQVTPTGIRFIWADSEQAERIMLNGFFILNMRDGTQVKESNGMSYKKLPDGRTVSQRTWTVPVDLSQVESLMIGEQVLELQS